MSWVKNTFTAVIGLLAGVILIVFGMFVHFKNEYYTAIYPGIYSNGIDLTGKTPKEVDALFDAKNKPLKQISLTIMYDEYTDSISSKELEVIYDSSLVKSQAYSMGRSGNTLTDAWFQIRSFLYYTLKVNHSKALISFPAPRTYRRALVDEKIEYASSFIDISPIEPKFTFDEDTDRVTEFRLGKVGRKVNQERTKELINKLIENSNGSNEVVSLVVETIEPSIGVAEDVDNLGIVELLGAGESYFTDSIPNRVYNIELSASRVNGILVAPGETFSFNKAIGDITAATGYKSAYVIKNGKTILDDGGGVCQVSTTLFRAIINAGLEIIERRPHSYRVSYYEQGGFKPGLDATIYPPFVDLKFKNNTEDYILITSEFDRENSKLTYAIYGKNDGRSVEISDVRMWDNTAPPPPTYQEDPTLATGTIKQIERATPGLKTAFDYKVVKDGKILSDTTIKSAFIPWRAVYLYGPGTPIPES